jgi:nicotinic acid mononucleotide adenylyltransferase
MLRLAVRPVRNAAIWTDEIDRARRGDRRSYTIQTLTRLARVLPAHTPLRLLIGADQAAEFHRWRDPAGIIIRAVPVVVWRPPIAGPRALTRALRASRAWTAEGERFWLGLVVPAPTDPMSSTEVRRLAARMHRTGRVPAALRRMLDPGVLRYIRENGLYRSG